MGKRRNDAVPDMARALLRRCQEFGAHALQRLTRSESHVAKKILAYFLRNPLAADSAEGVARWRVIDEQVRHSVRETFVALKWLVANGYLQESSSRSGATIFQLHVDHAAEARKLVLGGSRPKSRRSRT
jgi:hypothetical protein